MPATRSAVVVLTNCEDSINKVFEALDDLILLELADVPKISSPATVDAARNIFRQLQAGRIDRTLLGEEFSVFFDNRKVRALAAYRALGEAGLIPKNTELLYGFV
ncbi:MAG: hypothetical protein EXS36_09205 [Pedosphaera sp.]|nr:hypothetical protein [Pedosphaera sp.]